MKRRSAASSWKQYGRIFTVTSRSAVLSVFPHRRNPEISARLFEAFEQQSLEPDALANSPSTISVVLKQDLIDSASHALFEPFTFSAYQTPEDWKLAQEGQGKTLQGGCGDLSGEKAEGLRSGDL